MPVDTIPARFLKQAEIRPDAPGYYVRVNGAWKPTSWRDYVKEVRQAARSLIALKFKPDDKVCILGFNRPEWVIFDHATMMAGGAPAGIYTTCSPEEVQYIIHHAEARIVLLENEKQWEKVKKERKNLPLLEHVVMMKGNPKIDDPIVIGWDEFMGKGQGVDEKTLDELVSQLKEDQVATLIYTSGTTGPPKAVMLTHQNLAWTAKCAEGLVENRFDDRSLSYLPLSHIAEQMFTVHAPATAGSAVYFAESIERLADNLKEVQPTVFFGVPRIWEKFHARVNEKLKEAPPMKRKLVDWAMKVGRQVIDLKNRGRKPAGLLAIEYALANKLIYSKLKPALGLGSARVCVSGAAPVSSEILEFFSGLDIMVYEVYGQSEDTGPTSFNVSGKARFGSVGPVIPGVEVKIAEDEEILVKGPNVFKGYYKDPNATAETLKDGWLYSGDLGKFDAEGFLRITGRKKDIIITAGGKNIAPKNIEASLKDLELVAEAVVIGDRRKFLTALITLDPEATQSFAQKHHLNGQALHQDPKILQEIQKGVDQVNSRFARVEHVRKFTILHRNFTIDDGELTPTLKIKRKVINEHFKKEIDAMYHDDREE